MPRNQAECNTQVGPLTLADLIRLVEADQDLQDMRRRQVMSSIRCFARHLGSDPTSAPADFQSLRALCRDFHPLSRRISIRRWSNIRSDLKFALHRYSASQGTCDRLPISPVWERLRDAIEEKPIWFGLLRFTRFCNDRGIEPDQVDNSVAAMFHRFLINQTFNQEPDEQYRRTCVLWNRAVGTVPGWPQQRLSVPDFRNVYTLPLVAFPQSFQSELEAYLSRLRGDSLLVEGTLERPLSERSVEKHRYELHRFASVLVHRGHPIERINALAYLVELEHFRDGLRFFLDRSDGKPRPGIYHTARVIVAVAEHWVKVEAEHLAELKTILRRLACDEKGMSRKSWERLAQFDNPRNLALLLHLPAKLLDAGRSGPPNHKAARLIQTALAIEILLLAPMRIGNLARLNLNRHIRLSSDGRQRVVHISIPAADVKNREQLDFELSGPLVTLFRLYVERYRPFLEPDAGGWLFPGRKGGHKLPVSLSQQITKVILNNTGLRIHAHLFRHLCAKIYLDSNPGAYEVVRRCLGHRSIETTIAFYAGFEAKADRKLFADTVLRMRETLRRFGKMDR